MYTVSNAKVLEITRLYREGLSVRVVAAMAGVAKHTANRYRPDGLVCPCGKRSGHPEWCNWRIARSPNRQSYLAQCATKSVARLATVRARRELPLTTWPYVRNFDNDDYALLKLVNETVPRSISESVRADVCQEIITDVLSGDLAIDMIKGSVNNYLRRAYALLPSRFGPLSLDAAFVGRDGLRLIDTLVG